jgi:hypothetical protein
MPGSMLSVNFPKDLLEKEIQKTIQREIRKYLQNCGYVSASFIDM